MASAVSTSRSVRILSLALLLAAGGARAAGDDSEFLQKATEASVAEIALGEMVSESTRTDSVRQFGAKMVEDHTAALDEANQLASANGMRLEKRMSPQHEKLAEDLSQASGSEFDQRYMQAMVTDHRKAVRLFEQASSGNGAVAQYAERQLPVLRRHLEMAESIAGKP